MEQHFLHDKCKICDRVIIRIGDLELELHRPLHCTQIKEIEVKAEIIETDTFNNHSLASSNADNCEDHHVDDNNISVDELDAIREPSSSASSTMSTQQQKHQPTTKQNRKRTIVTVIETNAPHAAKEKGNAKPKSIRVPYKCTQDNCTEVFNQQLNLRRHLRSKHGITEKFECDLCNFVCTEKSYIRSHMSIHLSEKRYICSFCGSRFRKLRDLREHSNQHLGLKPYKCKTCGKNFSRDSQMRNHLRVNKCYAFTLLL